MKNFQMVTAAGVLLLLASCKAPVDLLWPVVADRAGVEQMSADGALLFWPYGVKGGGHPEGHRGWDIEAPEGAEAVAVGAGTVSQADSCDVVGSPCSFGYFVVLDLDDADSTVQYHHVGEPTVSAGDKVAAGDVLARFETFVDVPLMHFDVSVGLDKLCPSAFMTEEANAQAELWRSLSNPNTDQEDPAYIDGDNRYSAVCYDLE